MESAHGSASCGPTDDGAVIAAVRSIAARVRSRPEMSEVEKGALGRARDLLGPPAPRQLAPPGTRAYRNSDPFFPDFSFELGDDGLHGSVVFAEVFEGAGRVAHGGFVAAVFDHAFGCAALALTISRTASLTIDYRSPVPVERKLQITARVERTSGRKLWLTGKLTDGETVCAEAGALWLAVPSY